MLKRQVVILLFGVPPSSILGTATKTRLRLIEVTLNNFTNLIISSRMYDQVSNLYKNLNLLKLNDIYKLEMSKFIH